MTENLESPVRHTVTNLLDRAGRGDADAWDALVPLVLPELRDLAEHHLRGERPGHTIQPTALVHEAYLRLVEQTEGGWNNRTHFFGAAAQAMRRVLVDHARRRNAQKRGGGALRRRALDEAIVEFEQRSCDMLVLDAALSALAALEPMPARIVELRFFGGLTVEETARLLDVSPSTVERSWRFARAWLLEAINEEPRAGEA